MRRGRVLPVACAVALVDMMLYTAIAPLLAQYRHELRLSTVGAGILGTAYPAGTLAATLPALWLTGRFGARRTTMVGIAFLAVSSLAFALSADAVLLGAARCGQGAAGACAWIGVLSWLTGCTDPARRGVVLGAELTAAVIGETLGPALGTAATVTSASLVFASVAALCVVLLLVVGSTPFADRYRRDDVSLQRRFTANMRPLIGPWWLATLPALLTGALIVLGPLRLADLGASSSVIGVTWLAGAAAEAALGPLAGRISDRYGRHLPLRIGLACTFPLALMLGLAQQSLAEGLLILATIAALGWLWTPATALLCDTAERGGADPVIAFALVNAGWATGQLAGGTIGGALAQATTENVPYIAIAVLFAVTLITQMRRPRTERRVLRSKRVRASALLRIES